MNILLIIISTIIGITTGLSIYNWVTYGWKWYYILAFIAFILLNILLS